MRLGAMLSGGSLQLLGHALQLINLLELAGSALLALGGNNGSVVGGTDLVVLAEKAC